MALSFPSFADGRAFSTARILRERYGFAGEIRAVGDVQIDRYQFMRQCGFDAFEIRPERADTHWARAEIEMSLTYQPDYAEPRGAEAVWRARQAAAGTGGRVAAARHRPWPRTTAPRVSSAATESFVDADASAIASAEADE